MANPAKRKGDTFERELSKYLSEILGVDVMRSIYTGDPMVRKGKGNSDLIGVPRLAVEAKFVEKLSFPAAIAQAKRNAAPSEIPIVINRRSRMKTGDSYVCLTLDNFVQMYRAWAYEQGYLSDQQ